MEFEELNDEVKAAGLYQKRRLAYLLYGGLLFSGFALSFYLITLTDVWYIQLVNAFFFGFIMVQSGMLGHDFSHGQVFASKSTNKVFATFVWSLVCGISEKILV